MVNCSWAFPRLELFCLHRDHELVKCRRDISEIMLKWRKHNSNKQTKTTTKTDICRIPYPVDQISQYEPFHEKTNIIDSA